ncbi:hypothetical protein ACFC96_31015 [Streptomyces sp. NPDC055955]|uniref:hypothetical protein n=1 Tax=Streptomyces sp. NPDC055955 TaxID=3345665 RepID=UPI0035E36207
MTENEQLPRAWSPRMSDAAANAEVRRLINEAYRPAAPVRQIPTYFKDDTPAPPFGDAAPVHQDDRRIVPTWAAGVAVASLGIGAGTTGIGCGAWLVLKGFASMSVTGVIAMGALFTGLAFAALSIGVAISRARRSVSKAVYTGPVTKNTHVTTHARGAFARSHTHLHN